MGANTCYWQVRYEDDERTLVEYRSWKYDPEPDELRKTMRQPSTLRFDFLVLTGCHQLTMLRSNRARGLSALLYHVAPADPMTFVAVPAILALTGVAAAWIPALQASRADPAIAAWASGTT